MQKVVYILRAAPGAGKTAVAEHIKSLAAGCIVCCADDYFTDENGNYNWDANRIGSAHGWCKAIFMGALTDNAPVVVVSNTNTTNSDVNYYRNKALAHGYMVFVLVVENRHEGVDVHNVPDDVKAKMREAIINSIKL